MKFNENAFFGVIIISLTSNLLAQVPDTLWTRTYGGRDSDGSYSVEQTPDGGYILAGQTWSFGAGLYDFWLLKLDSLGDTLWTRTYGGRWCGWILVRAADLGRRIYPCRFDQLFWGGF